MMTDPYYQRILDEGGEIRPKLRRPRPCRPEIAARDAEVYRLVCVEYVKPTEVARRFGISYAYVRVIVSNQKKARA